MMACKTVFLCTTALVFAGASAAAQQSTPGGAPSGADAAAAASQPAGPAGDRVAQSGGAPATAAGAPDEGEIVVTGIRASLASSQRLKRIAPQQIDAVVAEDIGKLPDITVAETAARIPGIQVYRQGGEVSNVTVRGLDRPLYTTTYNGREIFTAEIRTVALQDFPSPNIAALEVYKTSTADLVEPGLAGLINVRSRKPFDFADGQIAGSAYGVYTRQADKFRPNGDLLLTKRFNTGIGEMGILVNGSYSELRYLDAEPSNTDFIANPTINGQQVRFPDIERLFYRSGDRIRPSLNGAFQWKPTPDLEIYADGLWQGFRNRIDDRLFEVPLYNGQSYSNLVFRPGTNVVSSGTVVGQPNSIFSYQGASYNTTDTLQFAGGAKYNHDQLHATFDVARTLSTFRGSTESIDRRFAGTPTINFNAEQPGFTISGINTTTPAGQLFQGLYEENQRSAGRGWQARGDVTYDFDDAGWVKSIQLGVRYTTRTVTRDYANRYAFLLGNNISAAALPVNFALIPGVNVDTPYQFVAPDYDSVRGNLVGLRQFVIANGGTNYTTDPVPLARLYSANEDTIGGYAQANLKAGDLVDGIVGIRVIRTKSRVLTGGVLSGIPAIDNGTETIDYLPNANLNIHLTERAQLRLSASKTRTLPNFADLNPTIQIDPISGGSAVGTDAIPRTGRGGNPFLKPFSSVNLDASLEYYFARTGYASAAVFRRDVDGFIVNRQYRFTDPTLGVVQINGPVNSGAGIIQGVELAGQAFLDLPSLPEWARGFGVQGNVTFLDARTEQDNGSGIVQLRQIVGFADGVSKWNYNITGIYEYKNISTRLSYNGRSSYPATNTFRPDNAGNDVFLETGKPAGRLDLSVNFDVIKQLTIFADWTNITKSPFSQDFSSARDLATRATYIRYYRQDESTVSAGIRFRFGS